MYRFARAWDEIQLIYRRLFSLCGATVCEENCDPFIRPADRRQGAPHAPNLPNSPPFLAGEEILFMKNQEI